MDSQPTSHISALGCGCESTAGPADQPSFCEQLQAYEPLVGEWTTEFPEKDGQMVTLTAKTQWIYNKNFIHMEWFMTVGGQTAPIFQSMWGWDALASRMKFWIFRRDGGSVEGNVFWDGETLKVLPVGFMAPAKAMSQTGVLKFPDKDTFTYHNDDHTIAGVLQPPLNVKFQRVK
jgi:hypothetical protein